MIEFGNIEWLMGGLGISIAAGLIGYGELRGKVAATGKAVDAALATLQSDIKRLDDRIADLTDFLLREAHGEDIHQIRRPTSVVDPSSSDS